MIKHKTDFGTIFIICLLINLCNEIWTLMDKIPEIFNYGDIFYHIFKIIFSIISSIAASIIAAIIFYYIVEFIGKKKDYENYTTIRKYIFFMFYNHLTILTKLNSFSEIKNRKRRIPDFYDIYDIPVLAKLYKDINTEKKILVFKKELSDFFENKNDIENFSNSFEKAIESIKNMTIYRYFKDSKCLIESIYTIYNNDFQISSMLYTSENDVKNKSNYLDELVDDYFEFLNATVEFYIELEKFIECIDKKNFRIFIKMLD